MSIIKCKSKNSKEYFDIVVDDEDFEYLSKFSWHEHAKCYPRTSFMKNGKVEKVMMHRLIMNASSGFQVDHIDGNTFNNKKSNLRICKNIDNAKNKKGNIQNKSGFKGVIWHKRDSVWSASIGVNYKRIFLGNFTNKLEAALAYNNAAIKYHGEFARLNII